MAKSQSKNFKWTFCSTQWLNIGRPDIISISYPPSILAICRLNYEDFSKFFVGLDIIIWPYYYERTPREIQKNVEFFRIFSNFHEFFWFLSGFSLKVFLYSEIQLRATHHKNLHEILRRTNIMRPRGTTGENWFYTKN